MLETAGHTPVAETPDVVLCDLARDAIPPGEAEAPVLVLTDQSLPGEQPAGVLPHAVTAELRSDRQWSRADLGVSCRPRSARLPCGGRRGLDHFLHGCDLSPRHIGQEHHELLERPGGQKVLDFHWQARRRHWS
jgi:hypothetical protein